MRVCVCACVRACVCVCMCVRASERASLLCRAMLFRLWPSCALSCSADLPEVRKLLGVHTCPDCQPAAGGTVPRTTDAVLEVLSQAMDMLVFGRKGDAQDLLSAAGLSWTHLYSACPMLHLLHFLLQSFPGDRLHLLCVCVSVRVDCY